MLAVSNGSTRRIQNTLSTRVLCFFQTLESSDVRFLVWDSVVVGQINEGYNLPPDSGLQTLDSMGGFS